MRYQMKVEVRDAVAEDVNVDELRARRFANRGAQSSEN